MPDPQPRVDEDPLADWPPLTQEQRELLASLLAPMRDHIANQRRENLPSRG